jgi:hypothetical protein
MAQTLDYNGFQHHPCPQSLVTQGFWALRDAQECLTWWGKTSFIANNFLNFPNTPGGGGEQR